MDQLPLVCHQLGTWPATQACALTGNQTHSLLVYGTMLQPAEPPGQGWSLTLNVNIYILFTYVYHIYVHLSISTNMGMFICNITEHVKYVCEIRSFFAGWTLFLLSSFYHYELNCVVQSCLLPYWQSRASKSVSYTHLTLPTIILPCRSRWSPYH